jgi:isochorismate hydrolase
LVLANAVRLGQMAQMLQVPAFGTEQNPDKLGPNDAAVRALCSRTLAKMHFSAVADGLADWLRPPARPAAGRQRTQPASNICKSQRLQQEPGRNTIVMAGCEAHVCLLQTALDLLQEEFEVWVVTDACSSRTERRPRRRI